jgi:hypothetical protein
MAPPASTSFPVNVSPLKLTAKGAKVIDVIGNGMVRHRLLERTKRYDATTTDTE